MPVGIFLWECLDQPWQWAQWALSSGEQRLLTLCEPFVNCVVSLQVGPSGSLSFLWSVQTFDHMLAFFSQEVLDVYALKELLRGLSPCKTCSIVNLTLDMLISIRQYLALSLFLASKGHLYMIIHNMWSLFLHYIIFAGETLFPLFLFFTFILLYFTL